MAAVPGQQGRSVSQRLIKIVNSNTFDELNLLIFIQVNHQCWLVKAGERVWGMIICITCEYIITIIEKK